MVMLSLSMMLAFVKLFPEVLSRSHANSTHRLVACNKSNQSQSILLSASSVILCTCINKLMSSKVVSALVSSPRLRSFFGCKGEVRDKILKTDLMTIIV